MSDTRRRVKVYTLNEDRQWDDRGTGHVSSTFVERLKGISLLVRAESDGEFTWLATVSLAALRLISDFVVAATLARDAAEKIKPEPFSQMSMTRCCLFVRTTLLAMRAVLAYDSSIN